jgi:hypothetical protein
MKLDPPGRQELVGSRTGAVVGRVRPIADQYGVDGNISEDPLFCAPETEDFTLQDCSPCAPYSPPNEECSLIGACPWPAEGPPRSGVPGGR